MRKIFLAIFLVGATLPAVAADPEPDHDLPEGFVKLPNGLITIDEDREAAERRRRKNVEGLDALVEGERSYRETSRALRRTAY